MVKACRIVRTLETLKRTQRLLFLSQGTSACQITLILTICNEAPVNKTL